MISLCPFRYAPVPLRISNSEGKSWLIFPRKNQRISQNRFK
nr:MAG TPA: hypothetical protein [Bacteriophage sp.]